MAKDYFKEIQINNITIPFEQIANDKSMKNWVGVTKDGKSILKKNGSIKYTSEVTYMLQNVVVCTADIDEDLETVNPEGFTFNIADAVFLGWTDVAGSTTPKTSIPSTGEPMTLYGIYKYNNKTLNTAQQNFYRTGAGTLATVTLNGDKYSSANIYCTCNGDMCGGSTSRYMTISYCGTTLRSYWTNINIDYDTQEHTGYPCYRRAWTTVTTSLAPGNNVIYASADNYVEKFTIVVSTITGIGRTCVG